LEIADFLKSTINLQSAISNLQFMPSFLSPLIKSPGAPITLRNQRTGAVVASTLEAAFERETRNKGLLGRTGLPDGQALVIAPCNGVHTFFMKFTIDVFFVARDGTVRKISRGLRPWRVALSPRSFAVIEMAEGAAARADVKPGDRLSLGAG
jgi:uncharacterized membrane protein (UPF0127 family)